MPASDDGYVTAETAVVVPALALLFGMLLWGVMAAAQYIQVVDGARAGARAAARDEEPAGVRAAVLSAAPEGATVRAARQGDLVRVRVTARSSGPGPLAVSLSADAVGMAEDVAGGVAGAAK
jgi:hypothetical protein